jgi:predicted oxidoreductase
MEYLLTLNVFDHADIYGGGECERLFGDALRAHPALAQNLQVITKTGIVPADRDTSQWRVKHYRAEADYVENAINKAIASLAVEQIDTFLIHRPDPLMQAEDVARVLEAAVSAGKIRQIGVSNFLPEQWRWLARNTELPLVCNQSQLSLLHTDPLFDGTLEAHLADGLRWLAWSPLGGGGRGAWHPLHGTPGTPCFAAITGAGCVPVLPREPAPARAEDGTGAGSLHAVRVLNRYV